MLKILQARLQLYVICALPDVQARFRKGKGTRDQTANTWWIVKKAREFQKKTFMSVSLNMLKPLTVWITTNGGKVLKEMRIPDHLTCLLRNLYTGQTTVLELDMESYLFNLSAEYIIQNARLDESQAEVKIARRDINNLRYAEDTTTMAESKEEWKSLLIGVKEWSEEIGLKLNIQKPKIMTSDTITILQIEGIQYCKVITLQLK